MLGAVLGWALLPFPLPRWLLLAGAAVVVALFFWRQQEVELACHTLQVQQWLGLAAVAQEPAQHSDQARTCTLHVEGMFPANAAVFHRLTTMRVDQPCYRWPRTD